MKIQGITGSFVKPYGKESTLSIKNQIAQFVGALRKRALTWYMNFTKKHKRSKSEIQQNFLAFFTWDVKNLSSQKLKEIKQTPCESICEYDKRFKDLLS
jgi:hypothetical protein